MFFILVRILTRLFGATYLRQEVDALKAVSGCPKREFDCFIIHNLRVDSSVQSNVEHHNKPNAIEGYSFFIYGVVNKLNTSTLYIGKIQVHGNQVKDQTKYNATLVCKN